MKRAFAQPNSEAHLTVVPYICVFCIKHLRQYPELWIKPALFFMAQLRKSIKAQRHTYKDEYVQSFRKPMRDYIIRQLALLYQKRYFEKRSDFLDTVHDIIYPSSINELYALFHFTFFPEKIAEVLMHGFSQSNFLSGTFTFYLETAQETETATESEVASFFLLELLKGMKQKEALSYAHEFLKKKYISPTWVKIVQLYFARTH